MTPLEHVVLVGRLLDSIEVPWVLGGSLASSLVGEPRSTVDVDIAVHLAGGDLEQLITLIEPDYYVSLDMARDAVDRGSSFNLLHHETGMKIDLFALGEDLLDRRQLERRMLVRLDSGDEIWVGSAEDQILRKLSWYRMGGEVSDRQWRDVLSIIRIQGSRLDRADVLDTAAQAGLEDLAEHAFGDVDRVR
jgi:hypothetical protein